MPATPPAQTDNGASDQAKIASEIADKCARSVSAEKPLFLIVYYEHENRRLEFIRTLRERIRQKGLVLDLSNCQATMLKLFPTI